MATVNLNPAALQRLYSGPMIRNHLAQRADRTLIRLQQVAPRDTGDLIRSLSITQSAEKGTIIVRIVSSDPNLHAILYGTTGPYNGVPGTGPGSTLGGWATRHGFTTSKSKIMLSRKIARHGTPPAGTFSNHADWVNQGIQEAVR